MAVEALVKFFLIYVTTLEFHRGKEFQLTPLPMEVYCDQGLLTRPDP